MSQIFTTGQSIEASASASVLPMNTQGWFPLWLTGWISFLSKGLSRVFSSTTVWKASILQCSAFFLVQFSYLHITTRKTTALIIWTFVGKEMSLLFNTLSRFVIAFLSSSNYLLISWLQSPSAVILELKKIKSVTVSTFPPSICHEVMGSNVMVLVVLNDELQANLKPLSSLTFIKRLFSFSSLSAIRVISSAYLEKDMAPHSSTLAWKIPWMEGPSRLQSMGSRRVGYDWATSLSLFTFMHWSRKWQPTPVFLPGESQGQRNLVGCRLWGCTELDMTEAT